MQIGTLYHAIQRGDDWYIIMEYCQGGELLSNKKNIKTEEHIKTILRQIFLALEFLHKQHITHMDIKQENIVFVNPDPDNLDIRLIDFGISKKRTRHQKNHRRAGSLDYMAPEVMMGKGSTESADMWAMGVMIFELHSGAFPFKVSKKLMNSKMNLKPYFDVAKVDFSLIQSEQAKDVIKALLRWDPSIRPTASEILLYPWFRTHEDTKLSKAVLTKLYEHSRRNVLQRALAPAMVQRMQDHHLIEYAHQLHKDTDKDLNGEFDLGEFKQCLEELGETRWTDSQVKEMFDAIDTDGSGEVGLAEFMEWYAYDHMFEQDERLWSFVDSIDTNNDGVISLSEVKEALKKARPDMWKEYYKAFKQCMPNGLKRKCFSELLSGSYDSKE